MSMFDFVEDCESSDRSIIEKFMLKAVENRCEGLMIKVGLSSLSPKQFL